MSSKNVNSFSTIDTVNTYSNSSLLGIVSGNLTRLTSGNLVLNKVNASNLIYNTGNQIKAGRLIVAHNEAGVVDPNSQYTFSVQSDDPTTWLEILNDGGADKGVFYGIRTNDFEQYNWQGGDILFFTSPNPSDGYERLRITKDGEVGIGVNSPSEKLEVDGNIKSLSGAYANNLVYNTGNQTISGTKTFATGVNINGNVGIGIDSNNNFDLYVRKSPAGVTVNPDSNSIAVFEGSGNSHITILAPNSASAGVVLGSPADTFGSYLTWNHDNNALKLSTAKTNGFIQLLTNNEAEAVRITSAGNVGIGTISPSEKLQVVGNILANNLVYNTGNQTISGVKNFASLLTVNNTGVLLSGQNSFQITFNHDEMNMNNNTFYFSNLHGLDASQGSTQRRMTIMQPCQARYASWSTYTVLAREQDSTTNPSTGYFVNNTTNASGIITTQLRHALNATLATFTGAINPPVNVNFGDQVQLVLRVPNYIIGMTGVNNTVDVTFYN